MTILIICSDKDPQPWVQALHKLDPTLDIQIWPNEVDNKAVKFALCWKHPEKVLQNYPNLKCICSMGAGVDHLLDDAFLPKHLPIIRLVDPQLAQSMFEYICTAVMFYFRSFDIYQSQQSLSHWQQQASKPINKTTIGIMGLGKLGEYSAKKLSELGFNVIGWSRSQKSIENIYSYYGEAQFTRFLAQTHILVCLLPLTKETYGILNLDLFNKLPRGAYLINVARGQHLVEDDLIAALDCGQLGGACLDVFNQEPLSPEHPFWLHKKIQITPHCSSITVPSSVAPQIIENHNLMRNNQSLLNQVDILKGY